MSTRDPAVDGVQCLPVVGVMGSGGEPWTERSRALGAELARLGVHLLTGGGGGVMEAVSRGFADVHERRGLVLGVLPGDAGGTAPPGYPNPAVELAIRTHLPLSGVRGREPMSRNHVNVLTADVVVALPGRAGTASEVRLALEYGRPLVCYLVERSEIPELPAGAEVRSELRDVLAFVRGALGLRAG